MDDADFLIPRTIPREEAERLLAEAYAQLDEGKMLRLTNKLLRKRGIDPPMDVQYVAEPAIEEDSRGWAVTLGCDILVYNNFPEMDACLGAFEEVLSERLVERLAKKVAKEIKTRR